MPDSGRAHFILHSASISVLLISRQGRQVDHEPPELPAFYATALHLNVNCSLFFFFLKFFLKDCSRWHCGMIYGIETLILKDVYIFLYAYPRVCTGTLKVEECCLGLVLRRFFSLIRPLMTRPDRGPLVERRLFAGSARARCRSCKKKGKK